jgi:HPt (histidine-containing phosphotransfer) domain-containing protein
MTAAEYDRLLQQLGGDHALLREVTQSFLLQAAELMPRICSAIASGDTAQARLWTHTLKGSIRVFGAETCGDAAERLELALTRGAAGADGLALLLRSQLERLTAGLAALAEGPPR